MYTCSLLCDFFFSRIWRLWWQKQDIVLVAQEPDPISSKRSLYLVLLFVFFDQSVYEGGKEGKRPLYLLLFAFWFLSTISRWCPPQYVLRKFPEKVVYLFTVVVPKATAICCWSWDTFSVCFVFLLPPIAVVLGITCKRSLCVVLHWNIRVLRLCSFGSSQKEENCQYISCYL